MDSTQVQQLWAFTLLWAPHDWIWLNPTYSSVCPRWPCSTHPPDTLEMDLSCFNAVTLCLSFMNITTLPPRKQSWPHAPSNDFTRWYNMIYNIPPQTIQHLLQLGSRRYHLLWPIRFFFAFLCLCLTLCVHCYACVHAWVQCVTSCSLANRLNKEKGVHECQTQYFVAVLEEGFCWESSLNVVLKVIVILCHLVS